MQTINLQAWNNQDFKWTVPMGAYISAGFDLSTASVIRMQARRSADNSLALTWSNQQGAAEGTIALQGQNLVIYAKQTAIVGSFPDAEILVYDLQIATEDGKTVTPFGGALQMGEGVTR